MEARRLATLQYAYGIFLDKGTISNQDFIKISNYPAKSSVQILRKLEEMGLIKSYYVYVSIRKMVWAIVDDKVIPEGWPPKGVLLTMENPYKDYVPQHKEKEPVNEADLVDAANNPLTRMILNKNEHVENVEPYKQLMEDTKKFYGKEEIDSLIKVIHEICKRRIEQQSIECPLCRGRLVRDKNTVRCLNPKCGVELNGGTFENSMRMLYTLAKNGVRVQ